MRLTRQMYYASKLLSENVGKKFTKGDVIKRIMKEHKASFGALLETKRQKVRRLKLEKKGAINCSNTQSTGDSELAWMLKVSNSRLRIVKFDCDSGLSEATLINNEKSLPREKDKELARVQMRRIRKTSGTNAAKCETILTPAVVTDNSVAESELNTKSKEPEKSKPKSQKPPEPSVIYDTNLQPEVKNPVEKVKSSILLPRETILENINKAQLHMEDKKKRARRTLEILSISPWENKHYSDFPSVTNILNATMPDNAKKMLELWMARMIEKMGQEGFDNYKRNLMQNGRLLHSAIEDTLRKKPVDVPENLKLCYSSVKIVLDELRHVRAIESQVVHQNLGYRGVVDCVASYRGHLCLIDWKKSDKTKHLLSSTYDAPLQVAGYIGALNADTNYPFQIKTGLLVIAYTVGNPPSIFGLSQMKLQYYWRQWLERLKKYYTMQNT